MKVILPRVGALVMVVALSWIAFAQAQRSGAGTAGDGTSIADTSASGNTANPLRNTASQASVGSIASSPSTDPAPPAASNASSAFVGSSSAENPARRPMADPFGSQVRGSTATSPPFVGSAIPNAAAVGLSSPARPVPPAGQSPPDRNSNNAGNILRSADTPSAQRVDGAAGNPLRSGELPAAARAVEQSSVSASPPRYVPVELPREAAATRLAMDQRREPAAVMRVTAEQPTSGPALTAAGRSEPVANNAYTSSPSLSTAVGGSRSIAAFPSGTSVFPSSTNYSPSAAAASPSATSQEPAPFKADPFASPANSPRPSHLAKIEKDRVDLPATDSGPAMEPAADAEGTGQPGGKQLEGLQSPQLTIQKAAPKEIQVNKPAVFRTTVRNVGQVAAGEVEVRDQVPKGTTLMSTTPRASRNPRGELVWSLGTLRPGEEAVVEMQVNPIAEGEIGSVATVHFGADASVRCLATRPRLAMQVSAPKQVMIGEQLAVSIVISNPGTGVATGVMLEDRIPAGLKHPNGDNLEYPVGNLKPGESRKVDLPLTATRPGPINNVLVVRGDGNLQAEDKRAIEIIAPALDVAMEGPKKRYLEREATYQFSVKNPGTAAARQVELVAYLPAGLKFVNANNAGSYDSSSRSVRWRLEELPANEEGSVELVTLPIEAGQQAIRLRGTAKGAERGKRAADHGRRHRRGTV